VDTVVDRARWRSTIGYRVLPTLQIGVEINPGESEFGPLFTWFVLRERHGVPGLFLGTSSDRIGTDEGEQSYYATATKLLPWLPLSVYGTLNYSEADEAVNFPFGGTAHLSEAIGVRGMYDGERTHLMGTFATERWSVSGLWVWLEQAGVSFSVGF
jgi:hypothetical protein